MNERWANWQEFELDVQNRVHELTKGWRPEANVAPIIELVRGALANGYELKPLPPVPQGSP